MSKNIVAIIGKPNVGKSTLFNQIIGKRSSITLDTPGVTRDRLYADGFWIGKKFKLIDTGGITIENDNFKSLIKLQASIAIEEANTIIFLLDGTQPLTNEDYFIADLLRKSNKNVIVVLNKLEGKNKYIYDNRIYSLGFKKIFPISAIHKEGLGDLLDEIVYNFNYTDENEQDTFKIALLGKPNVGKSTILNNLLNENRSIVSDVPGTTRDSVSGFFQIEGQDFEIIDTAGIKRKNKLTESVEHYSLMRAIASIEEAQLCLLILDTCEEITLFQQNIVGIAHKNLKPIIVVVNKWDLIERDTNTMDEYKKSLKKKLKFIDWAPIVFISALKNQRVNKLKEKIIEIKQNIERKINTNQLNTVMINAQLIKPASSINGKRLSIKFAKQIENSSIPKFLLFVNDKNLAHFTYLRYIENQIRENFDFTGTPIELILKDEKGDRQCIK
ncbi:ribosome biogenesis GTPase Der [Metamycoplasma hyosynoviae]|uniref:ribosome biogenesis GTPase Der n=1 Tax=Metamycoplasma hyosynoviae TaxID=29559 RepID=UPI0023583682|nr:ribosome biogenesis GTPase Der [Metamycoplasma hyosynoviae]MDC8915940.1 ribosome biogenesis GTPase Der [Metamycoplasma hyosynoviae]